MHPMLTITDLLRMLVTAISILIAIVFFYPSASKVLAARQSCSLARAGGNL